MPGGSAVSCISTATSSATCRRRRSGRSATCSRRSMPRRPGQLPRPRPRRSSTSSAARYGARCGPRRHARPRDFDLLRLPGLPLDKIRTNNPLERIMREIRRRTRVVGAFPDGQSCLNLAAARLRHIAGTQWSTRKYMNMAPLARRRTKPTEPRSREPKCEKVWTLPPTGRNCPVGFDLARARLGSPVGRRCGRHRRLGRCCSRRGAHCDRFCGRLPRRGRHAPDRRALRHACPRRSL